MFDDFLTRVALGWLLVAALIILYGLTMPHAIARLRQASQAGGGQFLQSFERVQMLTITLLAAATLARAGPAGNPEPVTALIFGISQGIYLMGKLRRTLRRRSRIKGPSL